MSMNEINDLVFKGVLCFFGAIVLKAFVWDELKKKVRG